MVVDGLTKAGLDPNTTLEGEKSERDEREMREMRER